MNHVVVIRNEYGVYQIEIVDDAYEVRRVFNQTRISYELVNNLYNDMCDDSNWDRDCFERQVDGLNVRVYRTYLIIQAEHKPSRDELITMLKEALES